MLKTNLPTSRTETLELPNGVGPGEIIAYTFQEEFDFSKNGEHFLTGRVEYASDPNEKNNTSVPIIVHKPASVDGQIFTFYTNFAPRTFRDSMSFITSHIIDIAVLKFIGKDSTAGILIEGDRLRLGRPVPEGEDLFDYNKTLGTQICFCIDATELDSLGLQFDLRQTYSNELEEAVGFEQPPTSAIRVLLNGEEISRYLPETNNEDPWQTHNLDLEDQLGTEFNLCFETRTILSLADAHDTIADRIFLDNIAFLNKTVQTSTRFEVRTLPLNIYPNPTRASAFIEIDVQAAGDAEIMLRNINGQIVWNNKTSFLQGPNTVELNVHHFEPGIYLVEVRTDAGLHVGKIIVQ